MDRWPLPPIIFKGLPPSSNNIRVISWKRKIQFLTKEAQNFRSRFLGDVVPNYAHIIRELDKEALYEVFYRFYFAKDSILNKTYGLGKKGSAKSRYKKMDAENRIKFLSDCLSEAIGIDDSHFFAGGYRKMCAQPNQEEEVHIYIAPRDPIEFGVPSESRP